MDDTIIPLEWFKHLRLIELCFDKGIDFFFMPSCFLFDLISPFITLHINISTLFKYSITVYGSESDPKETIFFFLFEISFYLVSITICKIRRALIINVCLMLDNDNDKCNCND